MTVKKIGKRLKQALAESNITQAELAKKLKKTRQQVGRWVGDLNHPSIDDLCEISNITGKGVDWLLDCPVKVNIGNQQVVGPNSKDIHQTYYGSGDMAEVKQDIALLKQAVLDLQRRLKK